MVACPKCGAENPAGNRFCGDCGSALAATCSTCGAENPPGKSFCGDCGAPLADVARGTAPVRPVAPPADKAPVAERRWVSVLFVDLVGFTAASERRDAEETRDLLSRYFETCQRLIAMYGGTVEKFIGDAVMAVWGTPVATEDDAERAVRAALDILAAVTALGEDIQATELRARAGVLTGEAAVTVGAQAEGMVMGDLVNTASRIQSAASPGTVLVGESTKRASEAAIAYDDAGLHTLKGKAEPVRLFAAQRVTAGRAGALRSTTLEAPFVGRDRELRLVKELFHGSADEQKAQLVAVTGIAGIGKSRLSWEFEKYVDGLAVESWWHRGRCLSYGEGVAYWALAEMVRMRCGIAEDEDPASARAKLSAAVEEYVPDLGERRWVEPRLAHLLGLEEGTPGDHENLFSAWRILFERLAERDPVALVFEDMQWADTGLLDFLEYLLEWSRNHPLFVLVLARPELSDKRPAWGAGKRSFTSLYLEPLSPQAMQDLLAGLVPGLPDDLRARILDRAQGVPLYAVETVRMLLDRGLLVKEGTAYRTAGEVETLEVPETLHAVISARLDGLTTEERRLVQAGSVLGKTFTKAGLSALTGIPEEHLEPLLAGLLRKEVLSIQADRRSPERGHYSFLQDIVKHVAYETIAKRERKEKHLAAAQFLSSVWAAEEDEIVEVVAAHYVDAYAAAPGDSDAEQILATAQEMLVRAGERAASLGATAEAQGAYERAAELTDDPVREAELHERAGVQAAAGARAEEAVRHFERAIERFESAAATHPAARVSARLAEIMWERGRLEEGLEGLERSFAVLSQDEPDEDLAALAAQLGRFMFFAGESKVAFERVETALDLAEALFLPEILSQALNTRAVILQTRGRRREAMALVRYALEVALEHDKPSAALRAYNNLGDLLAQEDRYEEAARVYTEGRAFAGKVGNRLWERNLMGQLFPMFALGDWDAVLVDASRLLGEELSGARVAISAMVGPAVRANLHRGWIRDAEAILDRLSELETSADLQERMLFLGAKASALLATGAAAEASRVAEEGFALRDLVGLTSEGVKETFVVAVEAAAARGDFERVETLLEIVDHLPPGRSSQFYQAHLSRFSAVVSATRGAADEADPRFKGAADLFREINFPFYLAVTQLEHGGWLAEHGRVEAAALLAEAREIFERLEARPWLERLEAVQPVAPAEMPA